MKKRFAAGILVFLLTLLFTVSASADSWPSFGSAPAGVSYNQPITGADGALTLTLQDENGDGIPETALPAGLQIEAEADPSTGLNRYYLRGLPTAAGDYSFNLFAQFPDGSTDLLHCTLRIDPAIPAVSSSGLRHNRHSYGIRGGHDSRRRCIELPVVCEHRAFHRRRACRDRGGHAHVYGPGE